MKKQLPCSCKEVIIGARASPLSRAQVQEILKPLSHHFPKWQFRTLFVKTYGDLDRKTSLRDLDKTDFFTREIDQLLLKGMCSLAVHSAKDLPEPLPKGLVLGALTKGVNPADSLVLQEGMRLETLPSGALIATSSYRREEVVKALRSDLRFCDLRGTIEERLQLLQNKEVDGVVIAEAALIRLKLTHLNRFLLPGETAPLQGRLALLHRKDDHKMQILCSFLAG